MWPGAAAPGPSDTRVPEDQQVLVEGARGVGQDVEAAQVASEAVEETDRALVAEARNGFARARVQGVELLPRGDQDAPILAVRPEGHAAVHAERVERVGPGERVEDPALASRGRVEGEDLELRRGAVEHAVHHDRAALDLGAALRAGVARAVGPGHGELLDVALVDLTQRGPLLMPGVAAMRGPAHVGRGRAGQASEKRERDEVGPGRSSNPGHMAADCTAAAG